jgi:hypothetical protein
LKEIQFQKCEEFLKNNNNSGIYNFISTSKDLLMDFLMSHCFFPFDHFNNTQTHFPFESESQERLMRKSISCVLTAAFNIHSNSANNHFPVRFVRVNLDYLGLKVPSWKKTIKTENSNSNTFEENEKVTVESNESVDLQNIDNEPEEYITLNKIVTLIPKFEKKVTDLSLVKMKEFRSKDMFSIKWMDYNPKFDLKAVSNNFSLTPFDVIVHDFGLQGYIIRTLTDFLLKYSNSLRISNDNSKRSIDLERGSSYLNHQNTQGKLFL